MMFKILSTLLLHRPSLISESRCMPLHTSVTSRLRNYYEILGLPRNASAQEIKAAYYEKAKCYHPDAGKKKANSAKFQEISEAYEVLSNQAKRRAYDSTTAVNGHFGSGFRDEISRNVHRPAQPISMSHVHYVYRTINREEEPKFRPFEEHCYEGSHFNRFEYRRDWDPTAKRWVYSKRDTKAQYEATMRRKTNILIFCLFALTTGTVVFVLKIRFFDNLAARQYYSPEEIPETKSGIYFLRKDDS